MAIRNFAKYIAAALVAVACTVKESTDLQAPTTSEPVSSVALPSVKIQFDDDMIALIEGDLAEGKVQTKSADLNAVLGELGIERLERIFPDAGIYEERSRKLGMHRFYKAVLKDRPAAMTKAVASLSDVPGIVSVTPSRPIQLRAFNDPYFSKQWHYVNKSYQGADINVQTVWNRYTKGRANVVVCVVDEPVDPAQPDLKANLWMDANGHTGYNYARRSYDFTIRPKEGDVGHGTHVAGTIAAVNNNGIGVCGIAGGDALAGQSGVRIMSHAIFSGEKQASDELVYMAIKDAADKGALICQNSWGFSPDGCLGDEADNYISSEEMAAYRDWKKDDAMIAAVKYFTTYAGCDSNGNQREGSPMKGGLVFFAAGNDDIDYDYICSNDPNVIAVGAFNMKGKKASYSNYGDWVNIAAPGGGAQTNADMVWSTLPSSKYGGDGWVGTSMACPHASGVAALIISYFGKTGFTAEDAKTILFSGLGNTIDDNKPIGKKLDALSSFEWALENGYTGGSESYEQHPPVVKLEQSEVSVKAHETVRIGFEAYDPDGDNLSFNLKSGSLALSMNQISHELIISGWKDEPGTYEGVFTVSDGLLSTDVKLTYTLLPNHAPKLAREVEDILLTGLQKVESVPLEGMFTDEDGETLSIDADRGDALCVSLAVNESRIRVTPIAYGVATVTVTATDFMGEDASSTFRVAVVDPNHPVRVTPEVASTETSISIESETKVPVTLSLYASTGGLVSRLETEASAFDPINLDVSTLAPGRYTAVLEYSGNTRRVRVIKY